VDAGTKRSGCELLRDRIVADENDVGVKAAAHFEFQRAVLSETKPTLQFCDPLPDDVDVVALNASGGRKPP